MIAWNVIQWGSDRKIITGSTCSSTLVCNRHWTRYLHNGSLKDIYKGCTAIIWGIDAVHHHHRTLISRKLRNAVGVSLMLTRNGAREEEYVAFIHHGSSLAAISTRNRSTAPNTYYVPLRQNILCGAISDGHPSSLGGTGFIGQCRLLEQQLHDVEPATLGRSTQKRKPLFWGTCQRPKIHHPLTSTPVRLHNDLY